MNYNNAFGTSKPRISSDDSQDVYMEGASLHLNFLSGSTTHLPSCSAYVPLSRVSPPRLSSSSLSPLHPRYSSNPSTTAMPLANLHNLVYSPSPLFSSASCNRDTNGWSEPKVCSEKSTMGVALVALSGMLAARHSYQRRTSVLCNRLKSLWSLHDRICSVLQLRAKSVPVHLNSLKKFRTHRPFTRCHLMTGDIFFTETPERGRLSPAPDYD